ncbi:MAG: hypothetical protein Q8K91_01705 [Hylemonella sp.]|nr:hypothetical protein [Hylemonella sp.]
MSSMPLRRWGPWAALAIGSALLLALAPPPAGQGVVEVVQARPSAPSPRAVPGPRAASARDAEVLRVRARTPAAEGGFERLWALPPAAATPAPMRAVVAAPVDLVPPPPTAPPLPYRFVGRYAEAGREGVVLQGPDGAVLVVHPGETLGDSYRVESVTGNVMVLHHLPLNLKQTMDIGLAR